jgi:cytochrome c-type biogenesis protein CcmH/NrfF
MQQLRKLVLPILALTLLAVLGIYADNVAHAQGGDRYPPGVDADEVYQIARRLYCDVCQGVPLSDCPSDQCRAWREEIAELIGEGRNEDQIRQYFSDRYGEKVSGVPLKSGNRILTFAIPLGLIGVATLGVGWQVLEWKKREDSRAMHAARQAETLVDDDNRPIPNNVDKNYLNRVLRDLKELTE